MPDGEIIFRTDLDNSELEKKYAKSVKKIESMEHDLSAKKADKSSLEKSLEAANKRLEEAKTKLSDLRREQELAAAALDPTTGRDPTAFIDAYESKPGIDKAVVAQEKEVGLLQAEFDKLNGRVEKYEQQIADATRKLEEQKVKAAELTGAINQASGSAKELDLSFEGVNDRLDKLTKRISKLASRVLVFSVITSILRSFRDYMGDVISTNDEASAAMARLKGALLTLIQPLVNVIIPAFTVFVNILTAVIGKIASFIAILGGSTANEASKAAKALNAETKALNSAGSAAKKASKSLAGFDEINRLESTDASSSGASSSSTTEPDFSWSDGITEDLSRIADLILLIGAGLALWKIGDKLPGVLGTIATTLGGILVTIGGLLLMWDGLTDAWENGVDWGNLLEMIAGLAAAAGGLYIAFGSVGAGIALVVGGLALLVTGFRDATKKGFNLKNTLLTIAGIVATGLGITLLTGSLIPLLVASIAGLLLALTVATGHGEELINGVQDICQGFVDFITGIFSGDIEKALGGIETMFDGLGKVVGAVISGVRDTILSFLDWLDEKTGGKLSGIIGAIKELVTDHFDMILSYASEVIDGVKQIFSGLIKFFTGVFTNDWDMAWEGVKDIFKGVWNNIVSLLEGGANLIIQGLNWLIKQMNKIKFTVPDWVPGVGGKTAGVNIPTISKIDIPRLAQGAVIPPNREFMAVLGDQKHGTNIEAPLETIQEAVAIVMEDMIQSNIAGHEATVAVLREILEAVLGIEIGDETIARAVQRYNQKMAVVSGGAR